MKSNVKGPGTVKCVCPCQFLGALQSQLPTCNIFVIMGMVA